MRIDIKKTTVYSFDELSDDAKQAVLEKLYDINVDYEWWNSIYEDAINVGIEITEFDINWGSYCHGNIDDAMETANKILLEHGKDCETYKTADAFLCAMSHLDDDDDIVQDETEAEFGRRILEDYRIILQGEFEYSTTEEAIVETIEPNEYEFTADGQIYLK